MKKLLYLLILASAILLKTGNLATAESYIVTIANIETTPGTAVNVPVTAEGFKNVSVIEMRFVFDDTVLDARAVDHYLQDIHSSIRARLASNLINDSTIAVSWYSTNPINIENGAKLFDLHLMFCGEGSDCPDDAFSDIIFHRRYTSVHTGRITDNTFEEVDLIMNDGSVGVIASPQTLTLATEGEGSLEANNEPYTVPLTIAEGATVSLEAIPATGWQFTGWTDQLDNMVSNEALFDYTMPGEDMTLTAAFSVKRYEITALASPQEGGAVSGTGTFDHGEEVTLTASPSEGYEFRHWRESGVVVAEEPTYSFTATSDRDLTAHFSEEAAELYTISLMSDPEDAGSLAGSGSYEEGEEVTISASPNTGYHFLKWTDAFGEEITTDSAFTYTMPAEDVSFTAHFQLNTYEITANADPAEGGSVNGEGNYEHGEEATLTALPSEDYVFSHWGENGEEISGERTFTFIATADRHLTAFFNVDEPDVYTLSLATDPPDSGTLSGDGYYPAEEQRTVSVSPNEGYDLLQWTGQEGEVISTNESFQFIMPDQDVTLTAHLELRTYEITLAASPEEGGTVTGGGTYDHGQEVAISASPAEGYEFRHWQENDQVITEETSFTFTAGANRNMTAHFTPLYTLTLLADPEEAGSVTGAGEYEEGEEVSLTADPETGHEFTEWADEDGQTVSTEAAFTYTMPAAHTTLTANFQLNTYEITLAANPEEGGSVTGGGTYDHGEEVTITASPAEGYEFRHWREDGQTVSSQQAYTFTVTKDRNLTAHFTEEDVPLYTLTLLADPEEAGSVTGAGEYEEGEEVNVSASPETGYSFIEWSNASDQAISTEATFTFTMPADHTTLTASFQLKSYEITLATSPEDGGSVTGEGTYEHGEEVTITAIPAEGHEFRHWREDGQTVSSQQAYTFTVTKDRNLTAHFTEEDVPLYTLTLLADPEEAGSVTGAGEYEEGEEVNVSASPETGYNFTEWTDEDGQTVSTEAAFTFTMPADHTTLTASFQLNTYEITLAASPEEGGSVTGEGTYDHGEEVTITASPAEGYEFRHWREDGQTVSTQPDYTFTATKDRNLTAHFTEEAPETFEVVFEVDLSRAISHGLLDDFDAETHQVYISGTMTEWTTPGDDPDNQLMEKTSDDPLVYRKVFQLEEGSYAYKYFTDYLGEGTEGEEWAGEPNRTVEVTGDMLVEDQFGPDDVPVSEREVIKLMIYPNPASTRLTIESDREIIRVRIVDMLGQEIHTGEAAQFSHQIDTSGFPNGIYILRVETAAGVTTERFQVSGN